MLPFPKESDEITLADWMELSALGAADKNFSSNELERNLSRLYKGVDTIENKILDTMQEIERRSTAAGNAYPFIIEGARLIQAKDEWRRNIAYIFCLCLTYFGFPDQRPAPINPRQLFEDLSLLAAMKYMHGTAIKFGAGCRPEAPGFIEAVDNLCKNLGEGKGHNGRPPRHTKDDGVDIVAWKNFQDNGTSKIVMFGQCASGWDYKEKRSEMNPTAFWNSWMLEAPVSEIIRSFFIPFRLQREDWEDLVYYSGVLFDRCRIASCANEDALVDERYLSWCISVYPIIGVR